MNYSDSENEKIAKESKKAKRKTKKKKKLIQDHQSKNNTINSSDFKLEQCVKRENKLKSKKMTNRHFLDRTSVNYTTCRETDKKGSVKHFNKKKINKNIL